MLIFSQIELLPIAYFIILMCVVCANVLAKLMGDRLVRMTTGPLKRILSLEVHIPVTGDTISFHIFEKQLIQTLNTQLLIQLNLDISRLLSGIQHQLNRAEPLSLSQKLYPQIYWSGCPPNLA